MSEIQLVQIAIERVQDDDNSPDPDDQVTNQACHICQQPFETDDIRATFSCCHAPHHAECLSEWLVRDRGSAGLPKCTRCKASVYPNGFHYATAQLATRSLHLVPRSDTRAVGRIRLEVRYVVEEELRYNPAGLLRRALRGENPAAARAFQDEPISVASRPPDDVHQHEHAPEQQSAHDFDGEGSDADRDGNNQYDEGGSDYSSPYEDEEDIRQEPGRAAEVRDWQYRSGHRLGTDEEAVTVEHVEDATAHIPAENGNAGESITIINNDETLRDHWRYGRGRTINDVPEQANGSNDFASDKSQTQLHTKGQRRSPVLRLSTSSCPYTLIHMDSARDLVKQTPQTRLTVFSPRRTL